jgi:hypothetical protein
MRQTLHRSRPGHTKLHIGAQDSCRLAGGSSDGYRFCNNVCSSQAAQVLLRVSELVVACAPPSSLSWQTDRGGVSGSAYPCGAMVPFPDVPPLRSGTGVSQESLLLLAALAAAGWLIHPSSLSPARPQVDYMQVGAVHGRSGAGHVRADLVAAPSVSTW